MQEITHIENMIQIYGKEVVTIEEQKRREILTRCYEIEYEDWYQSLYQKEGASKVISKINEKI